MTDVPMFEAPRRCLRCGQVEMIHEAFDTCARCRHLDHRAHVRGCVWCLNRPGAQAGEVAASKAADAADSLWRYHAKKMVAALALERVPFTAPGILTDLRDRGIDTPEPRAIGGLIQSAARAGLIRPTGRYVKSPNPEQHGRPVAEWVGAA